jgi:hypothetical protein
MLWQVRDEIVDDVMAFVQQHIKSPNWRYREVHSVAVRSCARACVGLSHAISPPSRTHVCDVAVRRPRRTRSA